MLGGDEFRVHVQRLRELHRRLVILPREVEQPAQAGVGEQRQGIEFLRLLQFDPGFIEAAHPGQEIPVPLVTGGVVGIQLNRPLELGFGS